MLNNFQKTLTNKTMCEFSNSWGTDKKGNPYTCNTMFDCCDCGTRDESGCGCAYCFSCNACEECIKEADE